MGYVTLWLVRCRSTPMFIAISWIGYIVIAVTGSLTVLHALSEEQQHWKRFFTSTCQLFGSLVQEAGHDQIEFSYSHWSDPLHFDNRPLEAELPQPHLEHSTRPLDVPQQFRWITSEESIAELHWNPVPDATEYELDYLETPDAEEGWETMYQGTETSFIPTQSSGWFRVRSLRITPLDDPIYERIRRILVDTTMTIPDIGSSYTMRDYSDQDYVFIVCPEMDANKDGEIDPETEGFAPVGERYPVENFSCIPPGVREPWMTEYPVTDRWGTWFSAVIALYRPDGTREGYVGVDYPVTTWQRNINRTQIVYSLFLLIVLVMYFSGVVLITRLRLASAEEKAAANRLLRAVEELTEAKKMAESAAHAKSYFLTNMNHEIRTPMNAVLGFAEIIGRRLLDCCPAAQLDDNRQAIALIEKSGSDLLTIINDILDFSKVDAGQVEIEWISVEPRKMMQDVHNVIFSRLKEKPTVSFYLEADDTVPKRIYSDPARLRQILGNVCGNAVKFSERGAIRLGCRQLTFENTPEKVKEIKETYGQAINTALFPKGSPITLLQFVVQDEGVGIPETLLPRLFQPFIQADASLTRKFGGTGLGLSIAKHLTELMGGDITVESKVNVGTTFRLTFAVEEILSVSGAVSYSGIVLLNNFEKPLSGMHVLVVEDGKVNQLVLTKMLQDAGATVQIAENGKLGIEAVESSKQGIDVILMDMQMPVMDGYEATFRLRQSGFRKPIIAVTAHALTGDSDKTLQAGCTDYMSKPVDRNKLIDMILKHDQSVNAIECAE